MEITILDSGYLTRDRDGTQEAVANRAGYDGSSSVSAFTLKAKSIKEGGNSANVDDNPIPSSTDYAELNQVSFENPKYTIEVILEKDDATEGYQYSQLYQLRRLTKTKGVKLIYPSGTSDTYKTIVELNGEENGSTSSFQGAGKELSSSTPHLIGRILDVKINDIADKKYFDITMVFQEE